jgi:hypothetical protein
MKRKIAELSGAALDYAVALAEGYKFGAPRPLRFHGALLYPLARPGWSTLGSVILYREPSIYWGDNVPRFTTMHYGDEIIDREGITVIRCDDDYGVDEEGFTTGEHIPSWAATMGQHSADEVFGSQGDNWGRAFTLDVSNVVYGVTRREAAMRCWAISELGKGRWDELDLATEIDIPEELCS